MALVLVPLSAIGCRVSNSAMGRGIFRKICQPPLVSCWQKLRTFLSASSRNKLAEPFVPLLGRAAAPVSLELRVEPFICCFTLKLHPALVPGFAESWFSTTARTKLRWVRSSSGLPSVSTSAVLNQGLSSVPPRGRHVQFPRMLFLALDATL